MKKWAVVAGGMVLALVGSAQGAEPGVDQWGVVTKTDPITDDERVTAGVVEGGGLGVLFQCSQGRFGAVLIPNTPRLEMEFITMDSTTTVEWRVDDAPAHEEVWNTISGGADSSYAVATLKSQEMAEAVKSAKDRLVVRVHGATGIFPVEGAREHISKAQSSCS